MICLKINSQNLKFQMGMAGLAAAIPLPASLRASRSGLFWANFILCMYANCCFTAPDQYSNVAIRFGDHDFLKESDNLVVTRRFHAVTLTLARDLERL